VSAGSGPPRPAGAAPVQQEFGRADHYQELGGHRGGEDFPRAPEVFQDFSEVGIQREEFHGGLLSEVHAGVRSLEGGHGFREFLAVDVGVDFHRREAAMAEQGLDGPEVAMPAGDLGGKRVP